MWDSRLILLLNMLTLHFYTQIIIHIKNASLLNSCLFPLLQISHNQNNQGINFYMLNSMYSIIILVILRTHMQTISILKQKNNVVHAHQSSYTHIHTYTRTCNNVSNVYYSKRIMSCNFNYLDNHIYCMN